MNEGRQITKEQAEACMRENYKFEVKANGEVFYTSSSYNVTPNTIMSFNPDEGWKPAAFSWRRAMEEKKAITIHADPNNTFERLFGSGELTFEEVGAALFRGEIVEAENASGDLYMIQFERKDGDARLKYRSVKWEPWYWEFNFSFDETYKYTLYKEPTQSEPTPEPLTLEALEARVKALEDRS